MRFTRYASSACLLVFGAAFAQAPAPSPSIGRYRSVTAERLRNPDAGDWLMVRRTYDGWGYSPLAQITTANVSRLEPVWVFSTSVNNGHEAPPIVNGGVMFVATPGNQVIAIDATSGTVLWRYRRPLPDSASVGHPTTRGVALFGDRVYFAAGEAVLVALDAASGREVWTAQVADNSQGYYMSLAPLAADGKVIVGTSGGERGVRGLIAAFDARNGAEAWRTYTIPAPGEPGSDTWPKGDQWKNGGAPVWVTGTYDPDTNLAFWGTGNGAPWIGEQRPGDNLYTSSVLALDAATGAIRGYHQYHWNDTWDWDETSPPMLIDYSRNGRAVKGLIGAARNGYLWFLERTTGPIGFVHAIPYVSQNVFRSIDPKTGRPDVDPARRPGTGKEAEFCPSHYGAKAWPAPAFSPRTRMIYTPANDNLCEAMIGRPVTYAPGRGYVGATGTLTVAAGADHIGEVQAWNVDTQQRVWTHRFAKSMTFGSMLATAGDLVFSGGTNDRKLRAFDAATGKVLWEFPTGSGVLGAPVSFSADGRQYIAVQSGWGLDARSMQRRLNLLFPGEYPEVPEGGAVWVFALP